MEMDNMEESENTTNHPLGEPPPFLRPPVSSKNQVRPLVHSINLGMMEYGGHSTQPQEVENQNYIDNENSPRSLRYGGSESGTSASTPNGYRADMTMETGQNTQATTSSMFNYQGDSLSPEHPHNFKIMPVIEGGKEFYYCHLCSFCGPDADVLKSHLENHFEHRCNSCDYTARTEGRLKQHIQKFHFKVATSSSGDSNEERLPGTSTGENSTTYDVTASRSSRAPVRRKVHRCKQCEFTCINKNDFWAHARKHIKEDKILQCPKCEFVTEYKHHLEYHLRNHFGSKPYKCQKCNYTCVNKSMLNSHMKSHTSIYQYRCASCTYATKYCHSLKLHLRKYDHKPASILNLDGTVEHDTSSLLTMKRSGPKSAKVKVEKKDVPERATHPGSSFMPRPSTSQQRFPPPPGIMPFWNPGAFGGDVPTAPPTPLMPMMGQLFRGMMPSTYKPPNVSQENPITSQSFNQPPNREEYNLPSTSADELPPHRPMNQGANPNMFGLLGNIGAERMHNGFMWPRPDMFGMSAAMKAAMSLPPFAPPNHMPMGGYMRPPQPEVPKESEQTNMNGLTAAELPAQPIGASTPSNVPTSVPAEIPLDLTKSNDIRSQEENENNRKRSRKGKAFKLDALCLKLQEKVNPENGDVMKSVNMFNNTLSSPQSMEGNCYPSPTASGSTSDPSNEGFQSKAMDESNNNIQIIGEEKMREDNSNKLDAENNNNLDDTEIDMEEDEELNSGEKFTCMHCDITFGNCAMYTMHMGYHGYQNPYVCNMCGEESADKVAFFCHIARAGHS